MTADEPDPAGDPMDDVRICWLSATVDRVLQAHFGGVSSAHIARQLHIPLRETAEIIRRHCDLPAHRGLHTIGRVIVPAREGSA